MRSRLSSAPFGVPLVHLVEEHVQQIEAEPSAPPPFPAGGALAWNRTGAQIGILRSGRLGKRLMRMHLAPLPFAWASTSTKSGWRRSRRVEHPHLPSQLEPSKMACMWAS